MYSASGGVFCSSNVSTMTDAIHVRFWVESGPPQLFCTAIRSAGHNARRAMTPLAKEREAEEEGDGLDMFCVVDDN